MAWGRLGAGVNARVRQGERMVGPRFMDVVEALLRLSIGSGVADVFHQVPLSPEERASMQIYV
eukprot:1423695-Lingulodinium_polyedra.AAC.1